MYFVPELQVKQYVAVVRSKYGQRYQVFETGDAKYYLFVPLLGETSSVGDIQFPVLKKDLQPAIKRALAHGWGNSL